MNLKKYDYKLPSKLKSSTNSNNFRWEKGGSVSSDDLSSDDLGELLGQTAAGTKKQQIPSTSSFCSTSSSSFEEIGTNSNSNNMPNTSYDSSSLKKSKVAMFFKQRKKTSESIPEEMSQNYSSSKNNQSTTFVPPLPSMNNTSSKLIRQFSDSNTNGLTSAGIVTQAVCDPVGMRLANNIIPGQECQIYERPNSRPTSLFVKDCIGTRLASASLTKTSPNLECTSSSTPDNKLLSARRDKSIKKQNTLTAYTNGFQSLPRPYHSTGKLLSAKQPSPLLQHHQSTHSLATFNNISVPEETPNSTNSGLTPGNPEVAKLKRELEMSQDIISSLQKQIDFNVSIENHNNLKIQT